jgi:sulfur carrier protein
MRLIVNGERCEHSGEASLSALIVQIGAPPERVATLLNDEVVPNVRRETTMLQDGDRVEILVFAGGG